VAEGLAEEHHAEGRDDAAEGLPDDGSRKVRS
jgi:hypothetical protein